ncbi:MAG: endolytic transglycosylase MltG [Candidatus Paceibacterota bacterium]
MDDSISKNWQPEKIKQLRIHWILLVIGFLLLIGYYLFSAPFDSKDLIIHIEKGQSVNALTLDLENKNAIRNNSVLKIFIKLFGTKKGIVSGDYLINKNSPVWIVAWQIGRGHHNIEPIKITIREGLTNKAIAALLADKLSGFRKDLFLISTENKQGYLFPDTYFFYPLDTTSEIVEKLSNNFDVKIKKIDESIKKSGRSLSQVIIMASILEGEAGGKDDIAIISGILWKRISTGMPLQVDIDKDTYINKGLPQKPLNNPGLMSINAAINSVDSAYYYYLHDKNGKVHYATTFEEHKSNISKYLK